MKKKILNKYFLNAQNALQEAQQQNRLIYGNNIRSSLQICYYDGNKLKNTPKNCINVPIKKLAKYLGHTKNMYPSTIDFSGNDHLTNIDKTQFEHKVKIAFQKSFDIKIPKQNKLKMKIKNLKVDFNDKQLRIFILNNKESTCEPYILENLSKTFKQLGHKVLYYTSNNDMQTYHRLPLYKSIYKFNPHIVIDSNNTIRTNIFNSKIINITFIQDLLLLQENIDHIKLRKLDFIFSLQKKFDKALYLEGIQYKRGSWCIDDHIFKIYKNIKKEKKIIFIGDSYNKRMIYNDNIISNILDFCINIFNSGKSFTFSIIDDISTYFKIDKQILINQIIPYIIRDLSIIWLCSIKTNFIIEIYGDGWDKYKEILPYYKGNIKYGKKMAKIYNSATFIFAPSIYITQRRIFEAIMCNAIPIVYDCRDFTGGDTLYDNYIYYFKTFEDLEKILNSNINIKLSKKIVKRANTTYFTKYLLKLIQKNLKKRCYNK